MNDKWWSVLFAVVMIGCGAMFVVAPFVGWWMPAGESSHSWDVDLLFYLILAITGFFFILTELLLVDFMFRYAARARGEALRPSVWARLFGSWRLVRWFGSLFNTSHKIEIGWTIVPAVILVYIAFAQVSTWADVKYKSRLKTALDKEGLLPVQVDLSARQFEWRFRYPSPATWRDWKNNPKKAEDWVRNPNFDDIYLPNELHCIMDRHVVVQLSTKDVIHSFNLPHMRVKQDALPGKTIPVWFKPISSNVRKAVDGKGIYWEDGYNPDTKEHDTSRIWQLPCAELCGWGHSRMVGRAYVHENEADFLAWLDSAAAQQNDFGKDNVGTR